MSLQRCDDVDDPFSQAVCILVLSLFIICINLRTPLRTPYLKNLSLSQSLYNKRKRLFQQHLWHQIRLLWQPQ